MEINRISVNLAGCVVLAEDVVSGLAVVVVALGVVLFGFARVFLRAVVVVGAEGILGLVTVRRALFLFGLRNNGTWRFGIPVGKPGEPCHSRRGLGREVCRIRALRRHCRLIGGLDGLN